MSKQSTRFVRRFRYHDLFDGERHELVSGVHFEGDCKRLQSCIVSSANYYHVRVQTCFFDGSLFVKASRLCIESQEQQSDFQASSVE